MNIVYFGSDQFAVAPLKALLASTHKVLSVVTQPDRERGRGLRIAQTPVKALAKQEGLMVYQPYRVNLNEEIKLLRDLKPDLFVVVAYGQILAKAIIDIPKAFCINLHASLLPRYRGAAPIQWALINGENATGVSIIKIVEEMDAGDIIAREEVSIDAEDTALTLTDKLSLRGAGLILRTIDAIARNDFNLTKQVKEEITFAPKLTKEDGFISWEKGALQIVNLIRGCAGWPGASTCYKGKLLKIIKARIGDSCIAKSRHHGEVVGILKDAISVSAQDGCVLLEELQPQAKRRMSASEFVAGYRLKAGDCLGAEEF